MGAWINATSVMVLRSSEGRKMQVALGNVRRISYHYGTSFKLHYTPLQMDGAEIAHAIQGADWCVVVIAPRNVKASLVAVDSQVFIPELVLQAMFRGRATLQTCAYACESAVNIKEYLEDMKQLHGISFV
jgi:hypothetical protein